MADKTEKTERHRSIMKEARERFRRCVDWESTARARFRDDVKFAEADAYNQYQWPAQIQNTRNMQKRPMLTINRVRQHNLDILNDARQSRVAIKVRPVRGGATYEAAELLDGVIKHIEYVSNAASAYQLALKFAVQGGIGWIRLVTDYAGDDTFDQEIFIRPIPDPLSVYLDPDITQFDGSDAKFGFVFTDMAKEEFDAIYPNLKDASADPELTPDVSWVSDKVRIAEYFRCVEEDRKLYAFTDPETGAQVIRSEKEVDKELLAQVIDDPATAVRSVVLTKVEHFKIIGDIITEEKVWPGSYVPLLRCVGEETVIDGIMDRKGHTRALIDSQRMFNYNASAAVEFGALQSKVPYIAPMEAIEEVQEYWNTANVENHSVLPYKHIDEDGRPIPMPQRQQPPTAAPVFMQGMRDAIEQMYLASGQNQADFGQPGNERSGVAIQQRQRQGDNSTYHYLDHQAAMIRNCGRQIIDLIPKVYDTERLVKMRDDAGNEQEIKIDPQAQVPLQKVSQQNGTDAIQVILNPKLGTYGVVAEVGPAYATKRQEAFAAFSQLLAGNKELIQIVGDIWMRFADIPGGMEAAERLKRMVPQQALADGPPPDLVAAQQQIQQLTAVIGGLQQKLADRTAAHLNDQEKLGVEAYKAQTGRLSALKDYLHEDPEGLLLLLTQVIDEAAATSGPALGPALEPTAELTAENMSPPAQPPQAPPAPQIMAPPGAASPTEPQAPMQPGAEMPPPGPLA